MHNNNNNNNIITIILVYNLLFWEAVLFLGSSQLEFPSFARTVPNSVLGAQFNQGVGVRPRSSRLPR